MATEQELGCFELRVLLGPSHLQTGMVLESLQGEADHVWHTT